MFPHTRTLRPQSFACKHAFVLSVCLSVFLSESGIWSFLVETGLILEIKFALNS